MPHAELPSLYLLTPVGLILITIHNVATYNVNFNKVLVILYFCHFEEPNKP